MPTLLIRMAAPLQAWGVDSKFETRRTGREPSKSGIVGFLAAAMGYRRNEDDKIAELSRLNIGIRVDKEGQLLRDYHTICDPKCPRVTKYVTNRYYLSDAIFLVGVECDNGELIEKLANALEHPVFPLFLGRRSCPPTLPICLGTREKCLKDSLEAEPWLLPEWRRNKESSAQYRFVMDANEPGGKTAVVQDLPLSFNPEHRKFGYRLVREYGKTNTESAEEKPQAFHDAFAELG